MLVLLLTPLAIGQGQARPGNSFPPLLTPLYLTGLRADVAASQDILTIERLPPVTQSTTQFLAPGVNALGVIDQQSDETWSTTWAWPHDLEITDAATVVLYFQANAQALTVFEVRLLDVDPDGHVQVLAKDSQQFVTAMDPKPVAFFMNAQGRILAEGHFLQIQVFAQTGNAVIAMQYGGATPSGLEGFRLRWLDTDADGISDSDERREGTNPLDPTSSHQKWRDSDDDGLTDNFERALGTDPTRADTDADGYGDGIEVYAGTDPRSAVSMPTDSNGNGLPDQFESNYFNNTTINNPGAAQPNADPDADGCNNLCEAAHGTNPNDEDTDDDGVSDGDEILRGTDPNDANVRRDSDEDGLPDSFERALGTDPNKADTDGDGFGDGIEVYAGTDPRSAASFPKDADRDGLPDTFETKHFHTTNVFPGADPDADGCDNLCEASHGTDPTDPDTDDDGKNDGQEIAEGTNPQVGEDFGPVPDRRELQLGAGLFALTSILGLFGLFRWKP